MAIHSFDADVAEIVGVNAAIIYRNICFWVAKNTFDNVNLHDGKYWELCTLKAFTGLYPYMSEKQIRGAIDKLVKAGLIETGHHSSDALDRTTWYTLAIPEANEFIKKPICQNEKNDVPYDLPERADIYINNNYINNKKLLEHISHTCACACEGTHEYVSQRLDQFRQEIANSTIKAEQVQKSYRIAAEDYETIVEQILLDWSVDDNITPNDINWKKLLIAIQYKVNANRKQLTQSFRLAKIKSLDINQRLGSFREKIRPHVNKYSKELCNRFYQYWTEMDEDGIMRFEYCYAFDVESRLIKFRDTEK